MKKVFVFLMLSVSLLFASMEIKTGWNLISVPLQTSSEFELETLLNGKATIAWKFNVSSTGEYSWEQWTPGQSVKMKNGDGVFVGVASGSNTISFISDETQNPIIFEAQNYLKDKWYLVGFGYDMSVGDIKAIYPTSVVWIMENREYKLLTDSATIIKAGQGFWFKNKGDKVVPSSSSSSSSSSSLSTSVAVTALHGATVSNSTTSPESLTALLPDGNGISLPYGTVNFTVTGVGNGGIANIELVYPYDVNIAGYAKSINGVWYDLNATVSHNVEQGTTKVNFAITDGSQFDIDGQVNGQVVDPGGVFKKSSSGFTSKMIVGKSFNVLYVDDYATRDYGKGYFTFNSDGTLRAEMHDGTLTVSYRIENGKIILSGEHDDILTFARKTAKGYEFIETNAEEGYQSKFAQMFFKKTDRDAAYNALPR